MHRRTALGVALAAAAALLTGCTSSTPSAPAPAPTASGLASTRLAVPEALADGPFAEPREVQAPTGWTVSLWARVDGARLAAWTPDGRLLVSRPESGDVQLLTPRADATAPPRITTLVDGLTRPHGLAFDGDTLYVAESGRVDAYDYSGGAVSGRRTLVDGLPDSSTPELRGAYGHELKSVAVGDDHAVYVSVGSTGNTSAEDRSASPERAAILRVQDGRTTVFASGVRNGTGLAVAPDGGVWTAVNNRDRIAYPYDRPFGSGGGFALGQVLTDYVNDHPLEPVARLTEGRDLGWPYCNPDPDVEPGVSGTALDFSDRSFVRDQELNADGSKLDCGALQPVEQGLPAHSAPLGMSFTPDLPQPWGAGALVGVHGSWNRNPPQAPSVQFLPWRDGTLQEARTLLGGFQAADGSRWGRPVAAVAGPDGAVYVTDDDAGAVYRMVPA
ncbi:PQQ-dependent sugar dehydrogenase [uncultured Amnibacterium sp.]|uniref:PQQ-dependent sugar dehydrogenase n=1 Tax=uncultured Amnibacterium sp. TaxID=1631851 RepID=UPI0035C9BE99